MEGEEEGWGERDSFDPGISRNTLRGGCGLPGWEQQLAEVQSAGRLQRNYIRALTQRL